MALRSMNGAFSLLRNRRQFAAGAAEVPVQHRSKDAGKKRLLGFPETVKLPRCIIIKVLS